MSAASVNDRTAVDLFAESDPPRVIDADPAPSPHGAGRHRLHSRPGMTPVWALAGIKPRRRRLFAPRPRLALLPGTGAK